MMMRARVLVLVVLAACASAAPPPPAPAPVTAPPAAAPASTPAPAQADHPVRPDGDTCFGSAECASGICEGLGCDPDHPGTCAPRARACTRDRRTYCGCDGQTFQASGSCPGRRFSAREACP